MVGLKNMFEKNKNRTQKKYKKFLVFFAFVFLFLTISHTALALEVTYPTIPGFPTITDNSKLPELISYFFGVIMISAGVLGVFSVTIAGIQVLFSAGNPGAISEARERIFGSILGIVLLMFSFILLQTINPQLINPQLTLLTSQLPSGEYIITPRATTSYTVSLT